MSEDQLFAAVQRSIAEGEMERAAAQVGAIAAERDGDPFTLLKCASLLLVIGDAATSDDLLDKVMDVLPAEEDKRLSLAAALRSMGREQFSLEILDSLEDRSSLWHEEKARSLLALERGEEALEPLDALPDGVVARRLRAEALSQAGDDAAAMELLDQLILDFGNDYAALLQKVSLMIRSGKPKDAVRYVDSLLKADRRSADLLALKAAAMQRSGKVLAAVNHARRALKQDERHAGALETLAISLLERGKTTEVKIMAGAISECDPGNPAAVKILRACI